MYRVKRVYEEQDQLIMKSSGEEKKISDNVRLPYTVDKYMIQGVIDRILKYRDQYVNVLGELNEDFPL